MSKIVCECGHILADITDYLSYKAKFVADQDFFDFIDVVEKEALTQKPLSSWRFLGDIFQCPKCNNLIIFDSQYERRCDFVPIKKNESEKITWSYLGDKWKGILIGHYYDCNYSLESKRCKGELYWYTNKESGYKNDMTLEELHALYYMKFREFTNLGILRSSFLEIGGEKEHSWDSNNTTTTV